MKKFLLSLSVFIATGAYVAYQYMGGGSVSAAVSPAVVTQQTQTPTDTSATVVAVTTSAPPPTPVKTTTPVSKPIPTPVITPTPTPVATPAPTPVATPAPAPVPAPTPAPKGQYVDGSYTGAAADAFYGMVQIQAVIQGGKLAAVNFLQYPNDRRTSQQINSQAMPMLKNEAIQAQSANVSGVSGATDTSQAFIQSLGDALTQAKS